MATPTTPPKPYQSGGGQGLTYGLPSWRAVPGGQGYGDAVGGEQVSNSGPDYFGMEQRPPAGWGLPYSDVMGGSYAWTQTMRPDNPIFQMQVQPYPNMNAEAIANLLGSFPPPSFFGGMADMASIDRRGLRPEGPTGEELALRGQLRGLTDEEYELALQGYDAMEGRIGTQEGRVRSDLQTRLAQLGRGYNERAQDIARAIEEYQAREAFTRGGIDYARGQIDYTRGAAQRTEAKRPQALEDTRTGFSARGLEFGGQKNRAVGQTGEQFNELARQYAQQIKGTEETIRGYEETLRQYQEGIEQQQIGAERAKLDYDEAVTGTKTEADRALEDFLYARGELGRDRTGASIGYRGKKLGFELQDAQERASLSRALREWEHAGSIQAAEAKAARKAEAEMDTWMTARVNELARYGMDPSTAQSITISEARERWGGEVPETYISGAMKPEQNPLYKTYGVDISPFAGAGFSDKRKAETRAGSTYQGWSHIVRGYANNARQLGHPLNPEAVMRMIHDQWVQKGKDANAQLRASNPGAKNLQLNDTSETAWREYVRAKHGAFSMLLLDAEAM